MKTRYVLLKLKPQTEDLYLIVTEPSSFPHEHGPEGQGGCNDCREYYEDKFCSAELLRTARQFARYGDADPHFLFEFIRLADADHGIKPVELFKDILGDVDMENEHEN
jgi:hypothetical protein